MRNRPARGATENAVSARFALPVRDADGDWLDWRETVDGAAPVLRTTVTIEQPRTIIARNSSPDMPFDRSINPYRGCDQRRNGCVAANLLKFPVTRVCRAELVLSLEP